MRLALEPRRVTQFEVETRLELVRRRLRAHAGGIELLDVTAGGVVQLRFTGMCTGCPLKPLTMATIVSPALRDLEGVSEVVAPGARVSTAAQARLRTINATTGSGHDVTPSGRQSQDPVRYRQSWGRREE